MMELRTDTTGEVVSRTEKVGATQTYAREASALIESALDGDYLLPVSLFETNKPLFDAGMRNLCKVLATGVGQEIRYEFSVGQTITELLVD
jgi:hypothetical protein